MRTLGLDPGETTGYGLFEDSDLMAHGIINLPLTNIWSLLNALSPTKIVMESFRLYPHRAEHKIFSSFPEIEVIGVVRLWCLLNSVELQEQSASIGKRGNDYLEALGITVSNKHARDAVSHVVIAHNLIGEKNVSKRRRKREGSRDHFRFRGTSP